MQDADVIVIGAGAAGLAAARRLAQSGLHVIVLEARDRIGGRVWQRDEGNRISVELGAEFIHGRADDTMAILREIGIQAVATSDEAWKYSSGVLARDEDEFFAAAQIFEATRSLKRDETVERFLQPYENDPKTRADAELARLFVEGFDAADPRIASAQAIADEWRSGTDFTNTRPAGGYGAMFKHLWETCATAAAQIRCSTTVRRIKWGHGAVDVEIQPESGESLALHAKLAVITLPVGVLRSNAVQGGITFEPELPSATQGALQSIEMGEAVRVVLWFRTPFWETIHNGRFHDAAFFRCMQGAFQAFWTQLPERTTTIVAWAGGPQANAMKGATQRERIQLALNGFGTLLSAIDIARDEFQGGDTHDWTADRYSRGAYSYVRVGGADARAMLAEPLDHTLFFAGEATATDGQGGTVSGALKTGTRAASQILAISGLTAGS